MSDDFDQAIAAREAASLDDFRNLHGKGARLLAETGAIASDRWPGLPWPRGEAKIRKVLFDRLATHQQLVVGVQSAKNVWLVMGTQPGDGEADLTIQVETWPSAADLQREIIGRADSAALGPEWQRTLGPWGGLRRRERLVVLGSQERASTWLLEGIEELDAAGVLELLSPPSGIE